MPKRSEIMREYVNRVDAVADSLYEMATLSPDETGLSFGVWVSPKAGAQHEARIKVTIPPWGANPIAVYSIQPFAFVKGDDWLSSKEEIDLKTLVELNLQVILDFWDGRILYDNELHAKIVGINDAPPNDFKESVAVFRVVAPKVKLVQWYNGKYHLIFDHLPSMDKFLKDVEFHLTPLNGAKTMWSL